MYSEWKITSSFIGGGKVYAVYRLIDAAVDHSGNREFATGYMDDRQAAVDIVDKLNGVFDWEERFKMELKQ